LHRTRAIARLFCIHPVTGRLEIDPDVAAGLDGAWLLKIARDHGIEALLSQALAGAGLLGAFAGPVRAHLELVHRQALLQHRDRVRQLLALHRLFAAARLSYVLLKEYGFDSGHPAAVFIRQSDFDLLVRPADLAAAQDLLAGQGYVRVARPWQDEYRYRREGRLAVDLQVSLGGHGAQAADVLDAEGMMSRARRLSVDGESIPVLAGRDAALFLVVHAAVYHNFTPFRSVVNCWNYIARRAAELAAWAAETPRVAGPVSYLENLCGYSLGWAGSRPVLRPAPPDAATYFDAAAVEPPGGEADGTVHCGPLSIQVPGGSCSAAACADSIPGFRVQRVPDPSPCGRLILRSHSRSRAAFQARSSTLLLQGDLSLLDGAALAGALEWQFAQIAQRRNCFLVDCSAVEFHGELILIASPGQAERRAAAVQLGSEGHALCSDGRCLLDAELRFLAGTGGYVFPVKPEVVRLVHLRLVETVSPGKALRERRKLVMSSNVISHLPCRPAVIEPWQTLVAPSRLPGDRRNREVAILRLAGVPQYTLYTQAAALGAELRRIFAP